MPPTLSLTTARLERTRDVLHELWRSLRRALPIVVGVAGPIVVASFALLAFAGLAPLRAATLPWDLGVPLWAAQTLLAAAPAWALRRRLLPTQWCVQLRCLPLPERALARSDLAVSAALLAPLGGLYLFSMAVFAVQRPAWWVAAWPAAVASLLASWGGSCALGALALAVQRRGAGAGPRRPQAPRGRAAGTPAVAAAAVCATEPPALPRAPGAVRALLWSPWWRGAMAQSGPSVAAGALGALGLALAGLSGRWPVVPGAAWAFAFSAVLIAVTERAQRAMEAHLGRLAPWLQALPLTLRWRAAARALLLAPMALALATAALAAPQLGGHDWRAGPVLGFVCGTLLAHLVLVAVPAAQRETHVGLWAVSAGLLTALGSELWN